MAENQNIDYHKRYVEASEKGLFSMRVELSILTYIIDKYKFISVAEYARRNDISIPGALRRIESGGVMFIDIAGGKLIIP